MTSFFTLSRAIIAIAAFLFYFGFSNSISAQTERVITDDDLTGSTTWFSDTTYFLDGMVFLESGTLYIEPGTVVKAYQAPTDPADSLSMLIITRDARIEADGNAGAPIIFTSEFDNLDGSLTQSDRGLWGGIAILGYATTNALAGELFLEPFTDSRALFGGADDSHDAGYMQFVSIRYSGAPADPSFGGITMNSLTLGALGSPTWFSHIEVYSGTDDGVEIFGGMPSLDHILIAYTGDDLFDTDAGFRGNVQFLYGVLEPGIGQHFGEHDGGIDNDTDEPQSIFTVSNATFVGPGAFDAGNARGLRFRDYSGGFYHNSIMVDHPRGVHLEYIDGATDSYAQFSSGNLAVHNSIFYNIGDTLSTIIFTLDEVGTPTQTERDLWSNSFSGNGNTSFNPGVTDINPVPVNDVYGADFTDFDPFFKVVDYKGAFNPAGNWAGGWSKMFEAEPYYDEDADPTLVAYYPLDGNGDDASGNGSNGFVNGPYPTENRFNITDAAMFFGGGENISVPSSNHPTGDPTVTYTAWIKPESEGQTGNIVFAGERNMFNRSSLILDNGYLAYVGESNDYTTGYSIPAYEWTHVAVVKDSVYIDFFVNGEYVEGGLLSITQNITNTQIFIGSTSDSDEFFHGAIDEVRIYNRVLDPSEITGIYQEGGWGYSASSMLLTPQTFSGATIDGIADETFWGDITENSLMSIDGSPAVDDFSGSFKTAWDSTYFYIYVNIFDEYIVDFYPNPWENDNVEFYFNFNKSISVYPEGDWFNHYDYDEYQLRIVPNGDLDGINVPAGTNYAYDVRGDGYSIEIALPWNELGIPGFGIGQKFGFNVHAVDQDDGEYYRSIWSDPANFGQYQPASFGLAALTESSGNKPSGPYMVVEHNGFFIPHEYGNIDYGTFAIDPVGTASEHFEIFNFGQDTLILSGFYTDMEFYQQAGFDFGAEILEDQSSELDVEVFLSSFGLIEDVMNFESNDLSSPYRVGVQTTVYDFVTAGYTTETFTIDALDNETYWDSSLVSNAKNNIVSGTITDDFDFSGTWKVLWDKENIYFYFNYLDDFIVDTAADPTENDAVDLIFDRLNDRDGSAAFENDNGHYRFYVNGPIDGSNVDFAGVESHTVVSDTGFTMEAKIPFAALDFGFGIQAINDLILGFDVAYNDNDNGSTVEGYASWGNYTTTLPDVNANNVGELRLSGRPGADVEFNVDMSVQILKGVFDPGLDFVDVPGTFNGWGSWTTDTLYDFDGDSIYTRTIYGFAAGENIEYKFRLNADWSQPHDFPGGGYNRTYTLDDGLNILNHIFNDEYATDLELSEIVSPLPYALYSNAEPVRVLVTNTGINMIVGFDVSYQLDTNTVITETVNDTLYPGDVYEFEFSQTIDLSSPGSYELQVWISSPSDEYVDNDSQTLYPFSELYVQSFPYFEDFESGDGNYGVDTDNGIVSWEHGIPDEQGQGLAIGSAYSGSNAWVTNLNGEAHSGERSYLVTPVFDFSNTVLPYLSFYKNVQAGSDAAVTVMYSIDTNQVWRNLGSLADDTNWYNVENHPALTGFNRFPNPGWSGNDGDWNKVTHHLSFLAGQPWVKFLIMFANDADCCVEGVGIDDVSVYDAPPAYNADIVWVNVNADCQPSDNHPISIDIRNQGLNPISNFDVAYIVDGGDTLRETFTGTINPGDTATINFSIGANLYTQEYQTSFVFEAFIDYPQDEFPEDDYVTFTQRVFGDYQDAPGWSHLNTCDGLFDNRVWSIVESDDGDVWFTGFYGIDRYDGTNITHYTTADGLAQDYSWTSLKDQNGNLWFPATSLPQITQYDGTNFIIHDVPGVFEECSFEDESGNVWFGSYSGNGILKFDGVDFTQYTHSELGMGSIVNSISQLSNGNIVAATDAGVVQFDGASWFEFDLNGVFGSFVSEIFTDSFGQTWFAVAGDRIVNFDGIGWADYYDVDGYLMNNIQDIDEDLEGNIYFGGNNEVFKYNFGTWSVFNNDNGVIPSNGIYALTATSDGAFWIGTNGGGVARYTNPIADVEFNVDMSVQIEKGVFDPLVDFVDMPSTLNGWGEITTDTLYDVDGDSIYTRTYYGLTGGDIIEYKFRMNGDWGQPHDFPGLENRVYEVQEGFNVVTHYFNDEYPTDLKLADIINPLPYALYSNAELITVLIENVGINTISDFNMSYRLDGGPVNTETAVATLAPGETFEFTFGSTVDLSAPGSYKIEVWIDSLADENPNNNYLERDPFSELYVQTFPYFEDFESGDGNYGVDTENGIVSWEHGIPDEQGQGLAIGSAYSGSNAWVTNLNGEAPLGERSWLVTPVFDFSNLVLPYLSFEKFVQADTSLSAVTVMYSVDTGKVWRNLGWFGEDTNWYNYDYHPALFGFNRHPYPGWTGYDADWNNVSHHLSYLAGQPWVKFLIGFANDAEFGVEGVGIDDVQIYDAPPQYNADIVWVNVDADCQPSAEHPISIDIRNQGLDPIGNFDVSYVVNGDTATETYTGPLNPGDTVTIPFTQTANLYTREYTKTYAFEAFVTYPLDGFPDDDRVQFNYTVFGDYLDKPGWKSYNTCDGLAENTAWSIVESNDGSIWFTGFYGINRFDGTNFVQYTVEDGLADNYSWTSLQDMSGNLWFPATGTPQITQFDGTDFIIHDVPGIFEECSYEDASGNLWFGSYSGDGILKWDGTDFTHFTLSDIGLGYYVLSISQLPNGNMVFATESGVVEYDGVFFSEFDVNGGFGQYVTEIFLDSQGRTWFANNSVGALQAYNGTDWFEQYQVNGVPLNNVQDIDEAINGNLYFGGGNNLFRFSNGAWNVFTEADGVIPSNGIYSVKAASSGSVWIGTYRGGVARYSNAKADIDFLVDMYYQFELGNFDPASDTVQLYTSLNNYESFITMLDSDGDGVYKVGFQNLPRGTFIEYNYAINSVVEPDFVDSSRYVTAYNAYNEVFNIYNDEIPANDCSADFEFLVDGLTVQFSNNSLGEVTDFLWSFGNGFFSVDENPSYTYANEDYYEVCLTIYNETTGCVDEYCDVIAVIDSSTVACNADFSYVENGNTITFTNASDGNITDYFWDFDDGTFAFVENPEHTFTNPGFYEVSLTVYDEVTGCLDEAVKVIPITQTGVNICKADFSVFIEGKDVVFTSKSEGDLTDYLWNFGDGSFSNAENPTHTYEFSDFYEVTLTVYDETSDCLDEYTRIIFVVDTTETYCNADFEFFVDGKTVSYNSLSSGDITDYFWTFGDGTFAYTEDPTKTYAFSDFYDVSLTVYDEATGCIDEKNKVVFVLDTTQAACKADFSYFAENTTFKFKSESKGEITDYFWDFGDGSYAYTANPSHTYAEPDFYYVTLSIYDENSGCVDEYSEVVVVVDSTANLCKADFEFYAENNQVFFTGLPSGNVTDHFWSFGDGYYAYEQSPTHTFDDPDFYEVCYTIYDEASGCMDEFCDIVFVVDTTQNMCVADFRVYTEGTSAFFTNKSQGTYTEQFWDFGDGAYSFEKNPSHTYEEPGYYEVSLTIYDEVSGCIDDKYKVVVIVDESGAACNARFNVYTEGFTAFFDQEAIGSYSQLFWDFDDGFNSNQENPSHTYAEPGYYEVFLTVFDSVSGCFDSRSKVVFIEGETGTESCKAQFSHIPQAGTFGVQFNDESFGDVTSWYWDFGDNTPAGTAQNPEYTYAENNYYLVSLTINTAGGCQDTYSKVIAVGDVTDASFAYFTYFADSITSTGHFRNKSRGNIVAYTWDFGDGYGSEQENPSHTYQDTGYYAVCLTTESATGEFKTYCNDIRIGNALANPCLFSCVWPGDANNDLEANHYDIMTIGLNYGMTGPMRDSVSIFWTGHFSQDWSTYQMDGTNNKHGDANGDGVIDLKDTLAVDQNFAFSHFFTPDKNEVAYDIFVEWDTTYNTKATAGKAKARMARPTKSKVDGSIYAFGFEIEVQGGEGLYWNTIRSNFNGEWFGEFGENAYGFTAVDSTKQMIYVAMTRLDQNNVEGEGDILEIYFDYKDGYQESDFSFIVTSSGGIDASGILVDIGGSFSIDLGENLELCEGESVTLDAGEGFETYVWSNGESSTNLLEVTETGKYFVTVTDSSGTSAIDSIFVTVHPLPVVDLGEDMESSEPVTLDAGSGFVAYEWQDGSIDQTYEVTETGTYWVQVTDENGCQNSDTIHVDISTSIFENNFSDLIDFYPNPTNGLFTLTVNSEGIDDMVVEIVNLQGQVVYVNEITDTRKFEDQIDVRFLDEGVYYLKVIKSDQTALLKLVIQQ